MLAMPDQQSLLNPPAKISGLVLCFDYGSKRIGVAVGQPITGTATPQPLLQCQDDEPPWQEIKQLIKKWSPKVLLVGIPFDMDHQVTEMTNRALGFAKELQQRFQLPVYGSDEKLTSFLAEQSLIEQGLDPVKHKRSVDSIAAKIILETWMRRYGE